MSEQAELFVGHENTMTTDELEADLREGYTEDGYLVAATTREMAVGDLIPLNANFEGETQSVVRKCRWRVLAPMTRQEYGACEGWERYFYAIKAMD